ncbi:hypothetical protein [Wenzhouxiangella sp. EGI_FJ10409]|uniref:hypothetical protein n=1 Tax=Wenzhouxiangella sp. EGI_FJ10409 TaxID=3243767 RepID=UPI0035D78F37
MKSILVSTLAALTFVLTGTTAALAEEPQSQRGQVDFGGQLSAETEDALVSFQDALDRITAGSGAKITDVSVDQSMSHEGDFGTLETSCTASATVGIPGGTEVSIEATAPTCTEAVEMVQDAIEDLVGDLDPE